MVTINDIKKFKPKFDYLIGIDSDGTVFDSMNIKHSHCFQYHNNIMLTGHLLL